MNKSELVELIAEFCASKKAAGDAVNALLDGITASLKKGNSVTLVGFGTFSVAKRKARVGLNPQTKEKIKIKARKAPVFKAGAALKAAVN